MNRILRNYWDAKSLKLINQFLKNCPRYNNIERAYLKVLYEFKWKLYEPNSKLSQFIVFNLSTFKKYGSYQEGWNLEKKNICPKNIVTLSYPCYYKTLFLFYLPYFQYTATKNIYSPICTCTLLIAYWSN